VAQSALSPAPDAPPSPSSLDELAVAHRSLMTGFATALGEANRVWRPRPVDPAPSRQRRGGATVFFPALVRLLTGAHVRKQLDRLAARCTQLEATLDPHEEADRRRRSWLDAARTDAERMAAPLPSLRVPGLFAVVPFVIGVGTTIAKIASSHEPRGLWIAVEAVALALTLAALRELFSAFRLKRELLLPGASEIDRLPEAEQREHAGPNSYRDADLLFDLLGSRRSPEGQLDELAVTLGSFLLFEAACTTPLVLGTDNLAPTASLGLLAFAFGSLLVGLLVLQYRFPKRVWT
jgi:hypothetical protein